MRTVLISLVSEQTIPNVLAICHFNPDECWFVGTVKSEESDWTTFIKEAIELSGYDSKSKCKQPVIVDQDSFEDCLEKIETMQTSIKQADYIVNITCGNKMMALASFEVFRSIEKGAKIGYIPIHTNKFIQIVPRKRPLVVSDISKRLNVEEYLYCYGFKIEKKYEITENRKKIEDRKTNTRWIFNNYGNLKGLLGFIYLKLADRRDKVKTEFSDLFDREPSNIEKDFLYRFGFKTENRRISGKFTKEHVKYLTGDWFEEFVFNKILVLDREGLINDVAHSLSIVSRSGMKNELDVAFTANNFFYHIECKTLGENLEKKEDKGIIIGEIYKKGALSTLLGKGEKRGLICTTRNKIREVDIERAKEYKLAVLTYEDVKKLPEILKLMIK